MTKPFIIVIKVLIIFKGEDMQIDIPKGFLFSSTEANIKYSNRDDLALILCKDGAKAAGIFTTNSVKAAPVLYSKNILEQNNLSVKAILVNSGNANACTGEKGIEACNVISEKLAELLGIKKGEVLLASTGVIGVQLDIKKIIDNLDTLIGSLSNDKISNVASAIMTTDTFPKMYSVRENDFTICGIAKGAGMINPNMATMLGFILTDADIESSALSSILREINEKTFNAICVDNDTSTNDTVFLLSSGKNKNIDFDKLYEKLYEVMLNLAKMIVKDGEGATKLLKVTVKGGLSEIQCKNICKGIANSLLVKTAFFGADPNWGRIICAVGYSDESVKQEKIDIFFDNYQIVKNGLESETFSEKEVSDYIMKNDEINIIVDLNLGEHSFEYYTCDISYDYVKINAEYRT